MKKLENIKLSSSIQLFAKNTVEGFITGMHKSPYHGFSVEFSEHRIYNQGESTKNIDWKLFARSDKLFVKRFEEETNLRCHIIIDASSSMYYPNFTNANLNNPNKLLFAVYSTAVLMNLLQRQRDAIGLSVYTDKLLFNSTEKTTNRHHQLLYLELQKLLDVDPLNLNRKTDSTNALHNISERLNRRSLVMLFTDLISDTESLDKQFEALKHLKYKKHEIILFFLSDFKTEMDFDFNNRPYSFIDVENNEEVKINPLDIKNEYKSRTSNYLKELKLKCLQYKIDLVQVDINKSFDDILVSYLLKRQKMF